MAVYDCEIMSIHLLLMTSVQYAFKTIFIVMIIRDWVLMNRPDCFIKHDPVSRGSCVLVDIIKGKELVVNDPQIVCIGTTTPTRVCYASSTFVHEMEAFYSVWHMF